MDLERSFEALERDGADLTELEGSEDVYERVHETRCEDLAAERKTADPSSHNDGTTVEVVVVPQRFTGVKARGND